MGALLESGMVGNIGLKHLKVIKEDTLKKWDGLGFLDGLKGHVKENVAQLYENQATNLINEATTAGDSGSFETVVFPIIRRVFSKLLANDIVSVQAMNLPIGKLFYFVPKITPRTVVAGTGNGGPGTGTHGAPMGSTGNPNNANPVSAATGNLYDAYYAQNSPQHMTDGTYDYSRGKYTQVTAGTFVQQWDGNVPPALEDIGVVSGPITTCTRGVIVKLSGFSQTGLGTLTGPDGNEQDSETFLSSLQLTSAHDLGCCDSVTGTSGNNIAATAAVGTSTQTPILFRVVTQKYGFGIVDRADTCDANGNIYLELDLSCPACISCTSVDGYVGMTGSTQWNFDAQWRQYATLEFEEDMGEVSFDLQGVTVSVSERKLRAQWSPELAQDVSAFHNIDAEAELTALLSEEVAAEIDREILRDLRKGAAWDLRWDYNGWKRFSAGQAPYTQKDWNQTLITAVNQISAQIHKSTLRGGANWIVCSSEVSAIFDDLEYFHVSNAAADQDQYNMGIEKIGTLSGRFTVYRDPYFPANQVLIGHKGTSLLDTGYVYAPYVPLQLTPTMYNPFNFTPIKGIMTRYAKKMVNNRFYGRITVDGVRTFDVRELR
eukprot:SAG11_NODE_1_length_64905_cov_182.268355_53_plen_602_part_00